MKIYSMVIVTLFFSTQGLAQEASEITGLQPQPFQWVHYLSDVEKIGIARGLAEAELQRRKDAGTIHDYLDNGPVQFSFQASFTQSKPISATSDKAVVASSSGNVTCSINIHNPHAGSGPGGRVVKAKSSGNCQYIPVTGISPPTIHFELLQSLWGFSNWGTFTWNWEPRDGLNPTWSASTAQVFQPNCINDTYSHSNAMYIYPPAGWTYTGPQPIAIPGMKVVAINNC